MKKIIKFIIIIIIIFISIGIITNKKENKIDEDIKENIIQNGEVGIVSHKYIGYGQIEVIIKNNTGKELEQVQVNAKCWDKNNNNLGTYSNGKYNINTIDKYKITIFSNTDTSRYELDIKYK